MQYGLLKRRSLPPKEKAFRAAMLAVMTLLALILIFPYFYMVSKSLMTSAEALSLEIRLFPAKPQWGNYMQIFRDSGYGKALLHTMEIIVFNAVAVPLSATFVAFGFARCKFLGKKFLFAFMLSTMMLPAVITQIPLYVLYSEIGWLNTLLPLTIPNLTGGGALYIFLARSFIQSLPADIDSAAKIDGAGALRRFFRIALPLCKPIIIYIIINVFTSAWGDYYGPLVWRIDESFPTTVAYKVFYLLQNSAVANDSVHIRMAAGVIMSVVPAALFFVFQKQLIEGVAMDGLKG